MRTPSSRRCPMQTPYAVVETLPNAGPGGAIENSPAIYRRVFVR